MLKDNQISILHADSASIWAGNCSAGHTPDIIRLSGALVAEDRLHIDLLVPQRYTETFFKNIRENPKISLMYSSILTFEAYQVKGVYLNHRPCTPEEIGYQHTYLAGFGRNVLTLGVRAGLCFSRYYTEPSIAIRMKAEEVYEQTPKAGTGNKIS